MPSINGPGFYANEKDQSFVAEGDETLGACFIGLTTKGPAFSPIDVKNWDDFRTRFGGENINYYMPYALKGYLKYASPATIIRPLGLSVYNLTVAESTSPQVYGIIYNDPTSQSLLAEIHSNNLISMTVGGQTNNFNLEFLSDGTTASNLSLDQNSRNYFLNILNTEVSSSKDYYVKGYNYNLQTGYDIILSQSDAITVGKYDTGEGSLTKYSNARTTWITSQHFAGAIYNLMKIHNLSDGNDTNTDIKISISNIKPSANTSSTHFGSFDLAIRDFGDTDSDQTILENYKGLNLDKKSNRYIGRIIGTKYTKWNTSTNRFDKFGEYIQRSKYVRVELGSDIILNNAPQEAIPFGFRAYPLPAQISASGGSETWRSDALFTRSQADLSDKSVYLGIDFTRPISDALSVSLTHSLGSGSTTNYAYASYSLDGIASATLATPNLISYRKFTIPMYKGWNALDPNKYMNFDALNTAEETAFVAAINIMGNPEEVNSTDVYMPGISDSSVIDELITKVENRKDIFAVIDTAPLGATISTQLSNADNFDSSYASTYYPWLRLYDVNIEDSIWIPPSVGVAEAIAFNDNVADPWWAPAGFRRGVLTSINGLRTNLYASDRKELNDAGVNPISKFPGFDNPVIWGQKTLTKKSSALESVNVRRLLIDLKKFTNKKGKDILFENSNPESWGEFINEIEPYLENIKLKRGLTEYKLVMDETINTPDLIDRNIMIAQIYLQPRRSAEILLIDFVIDRSASAIQFSV